MEEIDSRRNGVLAFHSKNTLPVQAELPPSLANMPELFLHLELVWLIFNIVRNSRFMSEFGVGTISIAEICTILDEFLIYEPDIRVYFIQLIQVLDSAYIAHIMKLRK